LAVVDSCGQNWPHVGIHSPRIPHGSPRVGNVPPIRAGPPVSTGQTCRPLRSVTGGRLHEWPTAEAQAWLRGDLTASERSVPSSVHGSRRQPAQRPAHVRRPDRRRGLACRAGAADQPRRVAATCPPGPRGTASAGRVRNGGRGASETSAGHGRALREAASPHPPSDLGHPAPRRDHRRGDLELVCRDEADPDPAGERVRAAEVHLQGGR
jgi:hypothetical protein